MVVYRCRVLSIGCLVTVAACSSVAVESDRASEPQIAVDESVQEPWEGGFWTCGVKRTVAADGRETVSPILYHFEKMTAQLQANEADAADAASVGLREIRSCDDALKFARAKEAYEGERGLEALDEYRATRQLPDAALAFPDSEAPEEPDEPIDKIMDGINWIDPGVVQINVWTPSGTFAGACSGTLVNSYALLTAAHCIPVAGTGFMNVKHVSGTCLIGTCGTRPPIRNALFMPHPDWSGQSDLVNDIGVVRLTGRFWPAPANSSSVWYRFGRTATMFGDPFFSVGYGVSNQAGGGSGVQRITSELDNDHWGSFRLSNVVESGRGRPCGGDSGGPAIRNDTGPHDLVVGVTFGFIGGNTNCPQVGEWAQWIQTTTHKDWIETQIMGVGSCNRFSQNGFEYARCW